ncbi:MAG TPA: hypothetical protein VGK22_00005, partial [Candidatus Angelobacter sp.]
LWMPSNQTRPKQQKILLLSKLLALTPPGIDVLLQTKGEVKFDRTVTGRSKLSFSPLSMSNLVAY